MNSCDIASAPGIASGATVRAETLSLQRHGRNSGTPLKTVLTYDFQLITSRIDFFTPASLLSHGLPGYTFKGTLKV